MGIHIPDDDAVNAAQAAYEKRAARENGRRGHVAGGQQYEVMQLKVDRYGFLGAKTGGQKKLARLIADGWEIVDSPNGGWYGRGLYTLRRPI